MKVKTKVSYASNPNGNLWMKDDSGFGQKMLAKMGWSAGQGLGRTNQGITKAISVIRKSDNRGVGCSRQWAEVGNAQMDAFADVLASLNSQEAEAEEETKVGLEETSKNCRFRLHYGKFTRGKDLSRHSEDVLKCIVGPRGIKATGSTQDQESESTANKEESGGVQYVQSVVNMADYFKQKMAAKLSGLRTSESAPQLSNNGEPSEDELETRPSFGGAFSSSVDVARLGFLTGGENDVKPTLKFEMGSSVEDSKDTKVKFEIGSSDEDSETNREVESSSDEGRPSFCVGGGNGDQRKTSARYPDGVKEEIDSQHSSDAEERERRRRKKEKKRRRKDIEEDVSEEEIKKSKKRSDGERALGENPFSSSAADDDRDVIDTSYDDRKDRKSKTKRNKRKRKDKESTEAVAEGDSVLPSSSQNISENVSGDCGDVMKKAKNSKRRKKESEAEIEESTFEERGSEDVKDEDTKRTKRKKRKKDVEREQEDSDNTEEKTTLTSFTPDLSKRNEGDDTKRTKRRKRKKDVEREHEDSNNTEEKTGLDAYTPDVSERNKEIWGHLDGTVFSKSNLKRVDGYRYYTLDFPR